MQRNIFSPRVQSSGTDTLSSSFMRGAQVILILVFGLLPLWFVPEVYVAFGLVKTFFVVVGVYIAIILTSLALLRSGKVNMYISLPMIFFWLFAIGTFVSALLSGDTYDAVFGTSLEVMTAGFTILMALVITLCLVFVGDKVATTRLLMMMLVGVLGVYGFTFVRLLLGADFLSMGIFTSQLQTLVGGLNDLALYAGLMLVIILVAIYKIPNNLFAQVLSSIIVLLSLAVLAIVNFYFVWVVVGLLGVMTFLYLIARDTWLKAEESSLSTISRFSLGIVALICVVSGSFVVSGDYLGGQVSRLTGVSYLEVRPSFNATTDIAKSVYRENALTGTGPNRFEDAWRIYKNPVINETQFWNTNFPTGNSYAYTVAVNTGLIGTIFFWGFILSLLFVGYRMLFKTELTDRGWNSLGLIVFSATVYLWAMTFWYTPGVTIMIITAIMTGLSIVVAQSQSSVPVKVIDVSHSRQHGFLLIAGALFVIITSTSTFIAVNRDFFTKLELTNNLRDTAITADIASYDQMLADVSVALPEQDTFVAERARLRLSELNRLIALSEPTDEDRQLFEQALVEGIDLTNLAIKLDPTNPFNHAMLGSFYGLLNDSDFEGVAERRNSAFARATELDPQNPEYPMIKAQIANRFGNDVTTREELMTALNMKRNYTDALFMLSQLDIKEGNATSAIATTKAIIGIEPYNPGRYFQLGLLLLATADLEGAKQSFQNAITLDPNYANARYLLALVYLDLNQADLALAELKIIEQTNQDNESLRSLITQIEGGDYNRPEIGSEVPIEENRELLQSGDQTITTDEPDTNLVSPINRVISAQEEVSISTTSEEVVVE